MENRHIYGEDMENWNYIFWDLVFFGGNIKMDMFFKTSAFFGGENGVVNM